MFILVLKTLKHFVPVGNVYLDFVGAIGTVNAGHYPPEVVEAAKKIINAIEFQQIKGTHQ